MVVAKTAPSADPVASASSDAGKRGLQVIDQPPSTPDILQADTDTQERKPTARNRSATGSTLACTRPVAIFAISPAKSEPREHQCAPGRTEATCEAAGLGATM
jgi:hypothetical protein